MFFLLLFLQNGLFASDIRELQERIQREKMKSDKIAKTLEEKRSAVKEIKKEEKQTISELNRVKKRLIKKKKVLDKIVKNLARAEHKIKKTRNEIEELSENINEQGAIFEKRVVAFYKYGKPGYVSAVFFANSYSELLRRYKYMAIIIDYDSRLLENYQLNLTQIKQYQQKLEKEEKEWNLSKRESEKARRDVGKERLAKVKILKAIQNEKKHRLSALKKLKTASLNLQKLIENLSKEVAKKSREEEKRGKKRGFAAQKGKFALPVEGTIITLFGKTEHPEFQTATFHNGIDIKAPFGTKIQSIYGGKVLYSGWLKGYGNIIIIDHGSHYYSLIAHLGRLFKDVGDKVKGGETVALVGDTGSLKGPYLYFEIRHHGKPEDPLNWLRVFPEKEFSSSLLAQ